MSAEEEKRFQLSKVSGNVINYFMLEMKESGTIVI